MGVEIRAGRDYLSSAMDETLSRPLRAHSERALQEPGAVLGAEERDE